MTDIVWNLEKRKLSELQEWKDNPRRLTEKGIKDLTNSITKFGCCEPIVINTDNMICGGHGRKKVLHSLKVKEVDCYVPCTTLSFEEFKELNLRLNKNIAGEFDIDILANNFEIDLLHDVGFTDEELGINIEEKSIEEDNIPTIDDAKTISKLGDVYQLGKHRIICGDCNDVLLIEKLMDGQKATIGFNDPPYGMKKEKDGVVNDNLNYDDLLEFNKQWIALQFTFLKENGSWYCWGTDEPLMDIYSCIIKPYIKQQKATFRNLITWDKGSGQGQNSDNTRSYAIADEKCLFVMCGVQGFNNNADNYFEGWEPIRDYLLQSRLSMGWDVPTMKKIVGHSDLSRDHWTNKSQFNFPPKEVYEKLQQEAERQRNELQQNNEAFKKDYMDLKKDYMDLKKDFYKSRSYFNNTHDNFNNVWHFVREFNITEHATPKPVSLCARAIKSSCPENEIVLDFFLGSGSTLMACEQTNRICYGCELVPKYIDVILKRYVNYKISNNQERNIDIKCNGENFDYKQLL